MRHEALPQGMTVEQLAQWLYENKIDSKTHKEEEPYTDEEIQEFEHKSSLASRSIDKLAEIEKTVKEHLKEGIFDDPISITLPPTKGNKALLANRKYADEQITLGYVSREIDLYGIPDDKTEKILFFDAEGNVWDDYSENMSEDQKHQYIGMFSKDKVDNAADSEDSEDSETPGSEKDVQEPADQEPADQTDDSSDSNDEAQNSKAEKPVNATEEQDSEKDSVVVTENINLKEESQEGGGDGAF